MTTLKKSLSLPALCWDARYRDTLAIALLWTLAVIGALSRPLMPIDETRYVSVAWEMWHAHSWVLPLMNAEPYSDKPPLLFWLIQAGWGVFGVNAWWPKLIAPLAALVAMQHLYRIARRLGYAGSRARVAPLVLMAMLMWNLYSGALMFDILLTACLLGAISPLVSGALTPRRALRCGVWLGLALLAKGPAVFVTFGPILLGLRWWRAEPLGPGGRRRLLLALALGIAMLAAWALSAAVIGGHAYARELLWGQSVDRLHDSMAHARPLWWYLPWLPVLLFPWSLWPAAWPRRPRQRHQRLMWIWALVPFVLFSLISGKQIHYLMPLLPALALMVMDRLAQSEDERPRRVRAVAAAIIALGALGLGLTLFGHGVLDATTLSLFGSLALIAWGAIVWRWRPAKRSIAARGLALGSGIALLILAQLMLAPLWQRYDVTRPGELIAQLQLEGRPVAFDGNYQATFQFAGRLAQPLATLGSPQDACALHQAHPDAWIVGRERDWQRYIADVSAVHTFDYRGGKLDILPTRALFHAGQSALCGNTTPAP
ncbi:glycosyltransferase family 39 protein [Salinicola endophyticus]|uniref:Glycosyltransferase family 39 protein n=1 Tax=Salinicola endophyticus TaxID=1949083 RepID=A0AB74U242_9GAMM